jgi:hypothetical protein
MRILLFTLIGCILTASVFAQMIPTYPAPVREYEDTVKPEKKKFDPSRLVIGGNLGVSFGDFTFVNISPQVGYMFSPMFTAGAGINYVHSSSKYLLNTNEEVKESYSYAGINLFGRFFPTNFLFLMAQPEINYSWGNIKVTGRPEQKLGTAWIPSFLIGGGIMAGGRGGRGGVMLSLQYDLVQDPRSPYGTRPFVGMGYAF